MGLAAEVVVLAAALSVQSPFIIPHKAHGRDLHDYFQTLTLVQGGERERKEGVS